MPAPSTGDVVALENLRLLDQRVRLRSRATTPNMWQTGTYTGMRDGEIQLRTDSGTTISVAKADLKDFEVSTGTRSSAGTGALVGGSIGLFIGYAQGSDGNKSSNNLISGKLAAAGVGAVSGIMIGALLGSQTKVEKFSKLNEYLNPELKIRASDDWRVSFNFSF